MCKFMLPLLALITITYATATGQTGQTDPVVSAVHQAIPLPSQTSGGQYRTETKYTDGSTSGQYGYQAGSHAVQVAYATPSQPGSATSSANAIDTQVVNDQLRSTWGVAPQATVYVPTSYSNVYPSSQQASFYPSPQLTTGYSYQAQLGQATYPYQQQTYSYGQPATSYYTYPFSSGQFRTGQYIPTVYSSRVQQGSYGQPAFYNTQPGQTGSQFYFGQAVPAGTQTADGLSQAVVQPSLYSHLGRYSNVYQTAQAAVRPGQWYPGLSSYAHIKPSA